MGGQRACTDEAFEWCPQPKQRQRGHREHKQRPSTMGRGKLRGNAGKQGNKQQPPGTMLARNYQGTPAGPLSCTYGFTILGHGSSYFGTGSCFIAQCKLEILLSWPRQNYRIPANAFRLEAHGAESSPGSTPQCPDKLRRNCGRQNNERVRTCHEN